MVNSVSTKDCKQGDYVYLRTASPIVADGRIVIPVDSYVQGVVSFTKRSGRVAGRAELGIRLETLTLGSGKTLKFSPHLANAGPKENTLEEQPEKAKDLGRIAITAGTGAAIGGLADRSFEGAGIGAGAGAVVGLATVLFTRGKELELNQGATLDVVFARPLSLD